MNLVSSEAGEEEATAGRRASPLDCFERFVLRTTSFGGRRQSTLKHLPCLTNDSASYGTKRRNRHVDQRTATTVAIRCQQPEISVRRLARTSERTSMRCSSCPLIVTKSNLCLPNLIFGRVVWTFQLCTDRTPQLCAYIAAIHKTDALSERKAFVLLMIESLPTIVPLRVDPAILS